MYLLPALAAGLIRCIYIDRLDKLSEGIGGQLRDGAVPLYPLNKLLYILCLLFLFMDLLLQTLDLGFEVFLFLGVVLAHHGEAFIHDFDVGQPKGGRIFHHDVVLFIERKLPLGGIVGTRLNLGIRVGIGENKRVDFTVPLAVIKIIVGEKVIQFLVGQFDNFIVFSFRIHFVKPPSLRFILCKNSVGVAKRTNAVNGQDERLRRH